ncbi:MAG: tetratricopeptide repeat protein [Ardenticatenaceae bacterium]|nr:tetratricopeptide repeat protein [Ardenticatenaceae bacterium]
MITANEYTAVIEAGLEYWTEQVGRLSRVSTAELSHKLDSIIYLIQCSYGWPETLPQASNLILAIFPQVERYGWGSRLIPVLERVVALQTKQDFPERVRLLNRLGQLYRQQLRYTQAVQIHKESETIAKKLDKLSLLAETHFQLSEDYLRSHNLEKAEHYGLLSQSFFQDAVGFEKWESAIVNTLGLISFARKQYSKSEFYFRQSVLLSRQKEESIELARTLKNLALVSQEQKFFVQAEIFYNEALSYLEDNEIERCEVLNCLGALHFDQGNFELALNTFRKADAPALRYTGNIRLQTSLKYNIGLCLLRLHRFEDAIHALEQAVTLWKQVENFIELGRSLGKLGEAYNLVNRFEEAMLVYDEAIDIIRNYPLENSLLKTLNQSRSTIALKLVAS